VAQSSFAPERQVRSSPTITEDMKDRHAREGAARLSTIRMLLAAIKQREVDERIELTDADVLAIIDKMIKQRRDSIAQFEAGKREDLAPPSAPRSRCWKATAGAAHRCGDRRADRRRHRRTGASGIGGMGKVMAIVKPKLAGRADMGAVSARIKAKLAG
jgi:uncharacterized protein YqeY